MEGERLRSEKEMFELILKVAEEDDRIRAVYMNGSRTNPNVTKDIFQDYDIVYLVTETKSFIRDRDWSKVFGDLIIMQLPDELDKIGGGNPDFDRCYGYLMQFDDGNRIDLHIETLDSVLEEYKDDKLTITLIDKDNVLPKIPAPTDEDYWVKRPTQLLYYRCCNEFWWVILYIAKGLWRDEILYTMDYMNFNVRPELMKMITWYAGILTDFSLGVGKNGKYLNRYLPNEIWEKYLQTFPKADIKSVWESVFIMSELFEEVALKVGKELDFTYDFEEAKKCKYFLHHVEQLPRDAKEIL